MRQQTSTASNPSHKISNEQKSDKLDVNFAVSNRIRLRRFHLIRVDHCQIHNAADRRCRQWGHRTHILFKGASNPFDELLFLLYGHRQYILCLHSVCLRVPNFSPKARTNDHTLSILFFGNINTEKYFRFLAHVRHSRPIALHRLPDTIRAHAAEIIQIGFASHCLLGIFRGLHTLWIQSGRRFGRVPNQIRRSQ